MNYAVVGTGRRANEHVRVGHRLREAGLVDDVTVRVIDGDPDGAADLAAETVDAATVATSPSTRHAVATELLEAGVDVLVEDPIALSAADAWDLVETADERDRTLAAAQVLRHHGPVRDLRRRIARGEFGSIEYLHTNRFSHRVPRTPAAIRDSLVARDLAVYESLLGAQSPEVLGRVDPADADGVDAATVVADYGETVGVVNAAWTPPENGECHHLIVGGTDRAAFLDYCEDGRLELYDVSSPDDAGPLARDDGVVREIDGDDPLEATVIDFLHAAETGQEPKTRGRDGAAVVETLADLEFEADPEDAPVPAVPVDDGATDRSSP